MPYHRYEGLDGKLKTFNSDKGVVWRRSRFCGDDRPEPYQWNFVYEVRHLPELPSGFLLVRSFDLADELYLEASEAAEKHHTSREFRLLEVERAQLFIQGMNSEPIFELEDLGSPMPQGAQMPPEAPATVATLEPTQDDRLVLLLKAWSVKNCKRDRKGENIFSAELPKKSHFYRDAGFKQLGKGRHKKFEELYEELSEDVAASRKFLSMGN
jgi:hypothetical protein